MPQFATKACSNASSLTEIKLNTTILGIERSIQRMSCLLCYNKCKAPHFPGILALAELSYAI